MGTLDSRNGDPKSVYLKKLTETSLFIKKKLQTNRQTGMEFIKTVTTVLSQVINWPTLDSGCTDHGDPGPQMRTPVGAVEMCRCVSF